MEIYADYEYYEDEYKGRFDESSFDKYSVEASLEIKNATHDKAIPEIKEVKNCMCKIVDAMIENEKNQSSIASEKVGNYSVTYNIKSQKDKETEYYYIINQYLGSLGLLGGAIPVV